MSNNTKITFNMLAADLASGTENIIELEHKGNHKTYNIRVSKSLGFRDAMKFVHDIVASCANMDTGEYTPEGFDFAMRINTLVYYAGFVFALDDPSDIEKAYAVAYSTDLFEKVHDVIDRVQFNILVDAAKDRIGFIGRSIISAQTTKINDLIEKMDGIMEDGNSVVEALTSDDITDKIADMVRAVEAMKLQPQAGEKAEDNVVAFPEIERE